MNRILKIAVIRSNTLDYIGIVSSLRTLGVPFDVIEDYSSNYDIVFLTDESVKNFKNGERSSLTTENLFQYMNFMGEALLSSFKSPPIEYSNDPYYLDKIREKLLQFLVKECKKKDKILVRLWYFPKYEFKGAAILSFDLDDRASYLSITKSPKLRIEVIPKHITKLLTYLVNRIRTVYVPLNSRSTTNVVVRIRDLWTRLNEVITPSLVELIKRYKIPVVLFVRPLSVMLVEENDPKCFRTTRYEEYPKNLKGMKGIEYGLHFGLTVKPNVSLVSDYLKRFYTNIIAENIKELSKCLEVRINGTRAHHSIIYYPETLLRLDGLVSWDSSLYGQIRIVWENGKVYDLGFFNKSKFWTIAPGGSSFPFYPIVERNGEYKELSFLEFPVAIYQLLDKAEIHYAINEVLRWNGVITILYHPVDIVTYEAISYILECLDRSKIWFTTFSELTNWWMLRNKIRITDLNIYEDIDISLSIPDELNHYTIILYDPNNILKDRTTISINGKIFKRISLSRELSYVQASKR
jgi:hypothetical protein